MEDKEQAVNAMFGLEQKAQSETVDEAKGETDVEELDAEETELDETVAETAEGDETEVEAEEKEDTEVEEVSRHVATYKRDGNEEEYEFTYDEDGRLTQECVDDILQAKAKTGLEAKAQRTVEENKRLTRELQAREARIAENDLARKQDEAISPYIEAIKTNPKLREIMAQHLKIEKVDYNPEAIKLEALEQHISKQERLGAEVAYRDNVIIPELGLEGEAFQKCADYLTRAGYDVDGNKPFDDHHKSIIKAQYEMARDALIGQGQLPNPKVQKLEKEKLAGAEKLARARKRSKIKQPGAGRGTAGTKAKGKPSLENASTGDFVSHAMQTYKK